MVIVKKILPTKVGFMNFTTFVVSASRIYLVLLQYTTLVEKMVWIENVAYLIAFIVSAGTAVIGILSAYQSYQIGKKPVLATLFYYQMFLFSFLIYGIWGNIVLRFILGDLNLSAAINSKLAFFIPVFGIPFMIVSWFMLLKFAYNLNGYKFTKTFIVLYFLALLSGVFTFALLVEEEVIFVPHDAGMLAVRAIITLNLVVHLFFILPFFIPKKHLHQQKQTGINKKWAMLYLVGVLLYSLAFFFVAYFGFISTTIAILLTFLASVVLPVRARISQVQPKTDSNINFDVFCEHYEISKREAEVIMEICSGKNNKAIADKLFITLQTVKDHNHRIYTKTGVKSRVQLANLVREKTGHNFA
jgi:DNA-binding CsgD family transcriptional regulator